MSEGFAELFESSFKGQKMRQGSIVSATVVDVANGLVIVDAGLKSEGFIPIQQFHDEHGALEISIGDTVDVALDLLEDGFGETKLSREKAKRIQAWDELEEAHELNKTVRGVITDRVKGGFSVDIRNLRAFLPGSLVDLRPVRDASHLQGEELDFKIIKIDRERNNVVISRKAVMETENSQEREQLLEQIREGMIIKGTVKNLTEYGAFLDLGGIDGLLHITDMAWKRVKNPTEIVAIGDEIEVKVIKFERERNRVSLGLKQMTEDPWSGLEQRYPVKTRAPGRVTNLVDYGCFVELEKGVEGLVHVSEMDWTTRHAHPSKFVSIGDEVEVMVLDIDQVRRRISLGIKQCHPNPWEEFARTHKKGDQVRGAIKSITDFGIFVGLAGQIDGLVHMSDISWDSNREPAMREYRKGQEVKAVILGIDAQRERISLGIKQLTEDPFALYIARNGKGSSVMATVREVRAKQVLVTLADKVEGTINLSELSLGKKVDDARNEVQIGQEMEVKITTIDRKKRIIGVSVKAQRQTEERDAARDYASSGKTIDPPKLGDILKERLDQAE